MSINLAFAGFRHSHILGLYKSAMENENVNIVGSFEENDAARIEAESKNGIKFTYDTYDAVLCDASVDAIAIGDYYGKRGEMVISALKHGKHVICDKPICTSLKELEEIEELKVELNRGDHDLAEAELGDLLFATINVARMNGLNPDNALERTNQKFIRRFNYVEEGAIAQGLNLKEMTLEEMDALWDEAKRKGL